MTRPTTPAEAWSALREGNERFVRGEMLHPSQGVDHRAELSAAQHPFAVIFGCSDSRVAAEIIFDQGLGDVFVVRTAGHVLDTTVIGSIEYGVEVLGASLVVVLGHDSCGAVAAATTALTTGELPDGFVRAIVDRVIPSIVNLAGGGHGSAGHASTPRSSGTSTSGTPSGCCRATRGRSPRPSPRDGWRSSGSSTRWPTARCTSPRRPGATLDALTPPDRGRAAG